MTERDRWECARWLLVGRLERLAGLSPLADLEPYRRLLATIGELAADLEAPPAAVEAMNRLEYAVREREAIQARAVRVIAEG